ncbi:sensor histidine kinase [Shewanella khirikhana]|uniref:histidine kinase n=1 Tax=Shewanella khirikhana TaxID=1965282 RepID=A0ABM7DQ43_9GAMM|nr:ATP-binding protein [Shewanella khirikhana]AZQ11804.1 Sensor protein FixL [Shewanella khirikhana]
MADDKHEPLAALGLRARLLLAIAFSWALGSALVWLVVSRFGVDWLLPSLALGALLSLMLSAWLTRRLSNALKSMELGLLNLIDNDFSASLPGSDDPVLSKLSSLFNRASETLRRERQHLYQRELLLDKVIQNSPNLMLLLDSSGHIIYANDSARHELHGGKAITGMTLTALAAAIGEPMAPILTGDTDGLFTLEREGDSETWHISRGRFTLNGFEHQLILLKQMTRELSRQEVAVWKKVIRVISHELNNSLAPMRSMVNSGRMLAGKLDEPRLNLIFDTIDKRTAHLGEFIEGYARFARLPRPIKAPVDMARLCHELGLQTPFVVVGELPAEPLIADEVQLEQVLLNLLKNAHESGSAPQEVAMAVRPQPASAASPAGVVIEVMDRGPGMSPEVLSQALLPFYSTKQQGTGLGLALCREIIEAHDGRISLQNRSGGGLAVQLFLPAQSA